MVSSSSTWLMAAALLCSPVAMANVNTGNMPDLGIPEPNWYPIRQGSANDVAVVMNETTTLWGDIEPYQAANASLCKWFNTNENNGRGVCKTDISWIHAAVGLSKAVFSDPVVNYILRFHLEGACYRSTQYSDNDAAQYCAPWWWDSATNTKVPTNQTCYEITQQVIDQFTGQPVLRKWGCAHKAPFGGPVDTNDTIIAPPDDGASNFTTVGATAAPASNFQPVGTSLPPAAPVAVPVVAPVTGPVAAPVAPAAAPVAPVNGTAAPVAPVAVAGPVAAPVAVASPFAAPVAVAGPAAVPFAATLPVAAPVTATVPVATATAPVAAPFAAPANATVAADPTSTTAVPTSTAPVSSVATPEPAAATTVSDTSATAPEPSTGGRNLSAPQSTTTTEAPATVPSAAPEAPSTAPAAAGGRRLRQAINNLAEPDTNGTATGQQTLTANGTADTTVTANETAPTATAPDATAPDPTATTATAPAATAPAATTPAATTAAPTAAVTAVAPAPDANATALAPVTEAPATVPAAAPAAPVAPAANVTAPAPLGFPTAAEDPSVQTTTAVAQGTVIATRADFVKLFEVYNQDGLEGWPTRQQWYACQDFTEPFSSGRDTCYREAFGKNFGLNAVVLRSMLHIMRFDVANCYGNFETNGAQQGQTPNQQWCEVDTASWIMSNTLPLNNITGTPQQPMSLDPTVTAPPPPPPPPPPFPPPPMVEPIQLVAVEDPFAPVAPAGGAGTAPGLDGAQGPPAADASPGERAGIAEEDGAHGIAAAATVALAAAAAAALLL